VTAPAASEAKMAARSLLKAKLVEYVNIVPSVTLMYEREGRVEESVEVLMIIKVHAMLHLIINLSFLPLHR